MNDIFENSMVKKIGSHNMTIQICTSCVIKVLHCTFIWPIQVAQLLRQSVFWVTGVKILGRVGTHFFLFWNFFNALKRILSHEILGFTSKFR